MRPRKDGSPANQPNRRKLTELYVRKTKGKASGAFNVWDEIQRGLCLRVQPSGHKAWKVIYRRRGAAVWYHIGDAGAIGLQDARRIAAKVKLAAAEGKNPLAERRAEQSAGTFQELVAMYLEQHAKKKNKSWRQADWLIKKHALPVLGKLRASSVTRSDIKDMMKNIAGPISANQALASTSAIFSWAIKEEVGGVTVNPCTNIDRNATQSRDRILSDSEVALFWKAFDDFGLIASTALKVILLLGQRPGEVARMRREHIADGWWTLPGVPVPELDWLGTKNSKSHRIWLPQAVQDLIRELGDETTGLVFPAVRGGPVSGLDFHMRTISDQLKVAPVKPHDLRRTHGSTVTGMGFGREIMNIIQNHKEGGVGDVYDRADRGPEIRRVMEAVACHILALATGQEPATNVVPLNG